MLDLTNLSPFFVHSLSPGDSSESDSDSDSEPEPGQARRMGPLQEFAPDAIRGLGWYGGGANRYVFNPTAGQHGHIVEPGQARPAQVRPANKKKKESSEEMGGEEEDPESEPDSECDENPCLLKIIHRAGT